MHDKLIPLLEGIEVIGSSDHLIIDIEDCKDKINMGDILEFDMYYAPMLYLTASIGVKKFMWMISIVNDTLCSISIK